MAGMEVVSNLESLIIHLDEAPAAADRSLVPTMKQQIELLRVAASDRMQTLFRNPSRMQASLSTRVVGTEDNVTGLMVASGLPYLRIQEYGGVTKPHDIFPVNAKALAFLTNNPAFLSAIGGKGGGIQGRVFAMVVHHPGSKMPERSYARYALAQRRKAIIAAFRDASVAAILGAVPEAVSA